MRDNIGRSIIVVTAFNSLLSPLDRSTRQKFNKEIQAMKEKKEEMGLTDL